ncbi:transposase domain-containing protein [Streptosporangium sp. CA-115845]|uniref:transposase domain-containing protein n=1 Tax=Streptosporangium sp. CA-115845 TaxID=3240071 RepID=UPI003D90C1B7
MKTEPVHGRLADHLSIGILTSAFPVPLLDEVVLASGCADQRRRALPARLTIYYVLALCMFPDRNYDEIMRLLLNGLSWRSHWARSWEPPSVSAISRARARLGAEPLRVLFRRVAGPLPEPGAAGSRLAGLRPVSLDGTALTVPETRDNAAFGYPDESARLPCVRVVAMADGGTHSLIDATIGGSGAQQALAPRLLRRLGPGVLLLAGPGARGAELWRQAAGTGTHLLWRTGGAGGFPVARRLGDGSFLSRPSGWAGVPVRVIPLPGAGRLVTTLVDPGGAPAPELVARYAERWVMDRALAWLRSDRSGAVLALRSRTPETVAQEIWALLCVYQAVRALTCRGAGRAWVRPASRVRTGRRAEGVLRGW